MRAPRCYLVYAVASEGISASDANDLLNDYVADRQRGIAVFHDHFTERPHGGCIVLDVRDDREFALLDDPGPLAGWSIAVHPLTFSLAATGFLAQTRLTLEEYRGMSFAELEAAEKPDPRFWWRKRK